MQTFIFYPTFFALNLILFVDSRKLSTGQYSMELIDLQKLFSINVVLIMCSSQPLHNCKNNLIKESIYVNSLEHEDALGPRLPCLN